MKRPRLRPSIPDLGTHRSRADNAAVFNMRPHLSLFTVPLRLSARQLNLRTTFDVDQVPVHPHKHTHDCRPNRAPPCGLTLVPGLNELAVAAGLPEQTPAATCSNFHAFGRAVRNLFIFPGGGS